MFATLYIKDDKVYIPTWARFEGGPLVLAEPILVTNRIIEEVLDALNIMNATGHPRAKYSDRPATKALFKITKVRSWKQLAREAVAYSISWKQDTIEVTSPHVDEKGRVVDDRGKMQIFSKDTPLETVVQYIISDYLRK